MPPTDPQGFKVLLVDDDERLAAMTARALQAYGLEVDWVGDGRHGLAEALKGRHDVVVLDLMLPGLSGLDVCRELRAQSAVPVIMLTALGDEADRVVGLETGADDYLPKPFSTRELLARPLGFRRHREALEAIVSFVRLAPEDIRRIVSRDPPARASPRPPGPAPRA